MKISRKSRGTSSSLTPAIRRVAGLAFAGGFIMLYVALMDRFVPTRDAELFAIDYSQLSSSLSTAPHTKTTLRFDWSKIGPYSVVAKQLRDLQNNCSLPYSLQKWRPQQYGLGSDLHVWSGYLWAGLNNNFRIMSPDDWLWNDDELCAASLAKYANASAPSSSFNCYMPSAEPQCPDDQKLRKGRVPYASCGKLSEWTDNITVPDFRAAATEFAFSPVSPLVLAEAERQAKLVFRDNGGIIPREELITIHVRWGDKAMEMDRRNVAIMQYIDAIKKIVDENKLSSVHVLVCTEDPKALTAFREVADPTWNIYVDQFYNDYLPYRENRVIVYNVPSHIANETKGKAGLWAMGSLLVALEANFFVLATKSNWSRVMNELRRNVVDSRCNGCTQMIDLKEYEC
mmetsp:Transcript_17487/g.29048  ORF Transcript_17487/g.29048 Transcript_17487/m.29048 type:complete len:400 (-) Transcript_17487:180-1379(-)